MAPKKTATTGSSDGDGAPPLGLTESELRFIKAIFDNMTQKPDADWDCVAGALGLKDAKCAKERFRQMSVRHGWREQQAGGGGGTAAASRRKRAAGAGPVGGARVKKTRTRAVKREAAAAAAGGGDETDVEPELEVVV